MLLPLSRNVFLKKKGEVRVEETVPGSTYSPCTQEVEAEGASFLTGRVDLLYEAIRGESRRKDKDASPAGPGRMSQTQEIAERQC